jgi:hypothetical protein
MLGTLYRLPLAALGYSVAILVLSGVLMVEVAWLIAQPMSGSPSFDPQIRTSAARNLDVRGHDRTINPHGEMNVWWTCPTHYESDGPCRIGEGYTRLINKPDYEVQTALEFWIHEPGSWNHFVVIAPPNQRIRVLSTNEVHCVPVTDAPNEIGCRHSAVSATLVFTVSRPPSAAAVGQTGRTWVAAAMVGWIGTMIVGGLLLSRQNRAD